MKYVSVREEGKSWQRTAVVMLSKLQKYFVPID